MLILPSVSSLSLISTFRMWNFSFNLKSPVGQVTEDRLMFGLHRIIRPSNRNTCLSVGLLFVCFIRTPSGKKSCYKSSYSKTQNLASNITRFYIKNSALVLKFLINTCTLSHNFSQFFILWLPAYIYLVTHSTKIQKPVFFTKEIGIHYQE